MTRQASCYQLQVTVAPCPRWEVVWVPKGTLFPTFYQSPIRICCHLGHRRDLTHPGEEQSWQFCSVILFWLFCLRDLKWKRDAEMRLRWGVSGTKLDRVNAGVCVFFLLISVISVISYSWIRFLHRNSPPWVWHHSAGGGGGDGDGWACPVMAACYEVAGPLLITGSLV